MNLSEFLSGFRIDTEALARIKNRVFVVGRFNQRSLGQPPEVFLFTSRRDLSDRYRRNFTGNSAHHLTYEDFVRVLSPAVAERLVKQEHQRFVAVEQVIPDGSSSLEGASVIDTFNYFFQRSVANTEQGAFKDASSRPAADLLSPGEAERGRGILTQIRKNLATFCSFQPRTNEIVNLMAKMLSQCAMHNGIPAFADGSAFPPGFSESLINFLYMENDAAKFSLDLVDVSGPNWKTLWNAEEKKPTASGEMLIAVVCAFRDTLVGNSAEMYGGVKFGARSLNRVAQDCLKGKEDLSKEFRAARNAFNGLRQILRSRVLLSMVLEWLLTEYRKLGDVESKTTEAAKDRALERAVLERWDENGLAKPVRRPSPEERARFSDLLANHYEKLLDAVVGDSAEFEARVAELPEALQKLAREIAAETKQRDALSKIAGSNQPKELQKAFRDATRTILLDVMCPVLYRVPVLSVQHLRKYLRQEVLSSYLTAIFLSDKDQDRVRQMAEDQIPFFEQQIDKATKRITNEGEIQARLLKGYFGMLASPEIEARLSKDIAMLYDVMALLESESAMEGLGVGGIVPKRVSEPDEDDLENSSEKTEVATEPIKIAVREKVRAMYENRFTQILEASAGATNAAGGADGGGGESAAAARVEAAAQGAPAAEAPDENMDAFAPELSGLEERISGLVDRAMPSAFDQSPTPAERIALEGKVRKAVESDTDVIETAHDALKSYERALHMIYKRYNQNPDKRRYRNKVERMALINMMLLFQKELGFGKVLSNLYQLLLDLVQYLDPEEANLKESIKDFMRQKSLSLYFDDAHLRQDKDGHSGVTSLRQTLKVQAENSLQNIVTFVSDLRGIKHLMDSVRGNPQAEVIVVNATASDFLKWLREENTQEGAAVQRMRLGGLVTTAQGDAKSSDTVMPPGLVYLSDIAFTPEYPKSTWIAELGQLTAREQGLAFLIPPMCISTSAQNVGDWYVDGEALAKKAEDAPTSVMVLGPSPNLNPAGDGFPTVLPAGYLFAAHLLAQPSQRVHIPGVKRASKGRFRIIGAGFAEMASSLNQVVWGGADGAPFAFAADFYLYVLLNLMATAQFQRGERVLDRAAFMQMFAFEVGDPQTTERFKTTKALSPAVLGGDAWRFKLDLAAASLRGVVLSAEPAPNLLDVHAKPVAVDHTAWFEKIVGQLF